MQALVDLQEQHPGQVRIVAGDLADFSLNLDKRCVDIALSTWGRLDGLIVNHAILAGVNRIADASIDQWREGLNVNLLSALALVNTCGLPPVLCAIGPTYLRR